MVYAVIDTNILVSARISKNPLAATVKVVASMFHNRINVLMIYTTHHHVIYPRS